MAIGRTLCRALRRLLSRAVVVTGFGVCPQAWAATPPPIVESIEVSSFSTDDTVSIRLPQTRMPMFTVRGKNFFGTNTIAPVLFLRPASGPDKWFAGPNLIWGGDNADGWITYRDMNLDTYQPAAYGVGVIRGNPDPGSGVLPGAFTIRPHGPDTLESVGAWGGAVNEVKAEKGKLYLGSGRRLVVIDEATFEELGQIDLKSTVLDLEVRNGYAFVCTYTHLGNQFCVVDARDPDHLQMVWNSRLAIAFNGFTPAEVELHGDFAYVLDESTLMPVFDVSNPAAPMLAGYAFSGQPIMSAIQRFQIENGILYAIGSVGANYPPALRTFDLSADFLSPPLLDTLELDADPADASTAILRSLQVSGDLAVCMRFESDTCSAVVVDASNPAALTQHSSSSVVVSGLVDQLDAAMGAGIIVVAETESAPRSPIDPVRGLVVYDIVTNPASPAVLSTYKTHGSVYGVRVIGSRAYLFDKGEGLIALDISNPASPIRIGGYISPSQPREMAKNGDLLYVSDAWNGFSVIDISDPSRPRTIGTYQTPGVDKQDHRGIKYKNSLVYLAAGYGGLDVVDVSNPTNPVRIHNFAILPPGASYVRHDGLDVAGNTAYLGVEYKVGPSIHRELWCLDITTPTAVSRIGIGTGSDSVPHLRVKTHGGVTHVCGNMRDVATYNTSDQKHPAALSWLEGQVSHFARAGDLVYTACDDCPSSPLDNDRAIEIHDVSMPASPQAIGMFNANYGRDSSPSDASDSESYLCLAASPLRLYAIAPLNTLTGPTGSQSLYLFRPSGSGARLVLSASLDSGEFLGENDSNFAHDGAMLHAEEPYIYASNQRSSFYHSSNLGIGHGLVIVRRRSDTVAADLNSNGFVGSDDLAMLLGSWGACPAPLHACVEDLNGDGLVNSADLASLLGAWSNH